MLRNIILFFVILIITVLTGCSNETEINFSKMSDSEIMDYVINYGEIKSVIAGEKISNGLVNEINIDEEMLDMILKSSPECEGLLSLGNYKWADIATDSSHINAFISLDENKVKCTYTRKKFSPR